MDVGSPGGDEGIHTGGHLVGGIRAGVGSQEEGEESLHGVSSPEEGKGRVRAAATWYGVWPPFSLAHTAMQGIMNGVVCFLFVSVSSAPLLCPPQLEYTGGRDVGHCCILRA